MRAASDPHREVKLGLGNVSTKLDVAQGLATAPLGLLTLLPTDLLHCVLQQLTPRELCSGEPDQPPYNPTFHLAGLLRVRVHLYTCAPRALTASHRCAYTLAALQWPAPHGFCALWQSWTPIGAGSLPSCSPGCSSSLSAHRQPGGPAALPPGGIVLRRCAAARPSRHKYTTESKVWQCAACS